MAKSKRAVDPSLLPHDRPCWCTECKRAYGRAYMATTEAPSVMRECPGCKRKPTRHGVYCESCQVPNLARRCKRCRNCDGMFEAENGNRIWCSPQCREQGRRVKAQILTRSCIWCHTVYSTTDGRIAQKRLCSRTCRTQFEAHNKVWHTVTYCPVPQCAECGQLGGFDPLIRTRCEACQFDSEALMRGANYARRRDAVRKGDDITLEALRKRDNNVCHLCRAQGKKKVKVRTSGGSLSEWYPTVDHLIPISKGGAHTWDNVALAHRGCNVRRGNRGTVQLRIA